jgi:hypothetical protein
LLYCSNEFLLLGGNVATKTSNTQIVMGCAHVPYHNRSLWHGVCQLIKDIKPNGINLIGDIMDMNAFSFHDRGQTPLITASLEYKLARPWFDELDSAVGNRKVEKRYLYGNHEDRYLRHLSSPDSLRIICDPPEEAMNLEGRGYEVRTDWKEDYFILGDHLEIFHGELLGINPAKRQLDKLKRSCMFAHSHRVGTHYDGDMAAFNIGGLFNKEAPAFKYLGRIAKRSWMNAFAIVTVDNNGYYYPHIITAYRDKFYYNGKQYGGK